MKIILLIITLSLLGFSNALIYEDNPDTAQILKDLQVRASASPSEPNTTVCFEFEGCFTNKGLWANTGNFLPIHPDDLKTQLLLVTRKFQEIETAELIDYKHAESLKDTKFDKSLPLKFIIHGFSNDRSSPWILKIAKSILAKENVNIIVVDWGQGAKFPFYNNASTNIRLVGRQVGLFVNDLRSKYYADSPKSLKVHCIGHSLGAHTCGLASNAANIRFNRISGMDPAGPFFEGMDPILRLDPVDADYVDAIHTNGGSVTTLSFGIVMPVGHIDFYPNGGKFQRGCPGITSILGGIFNGGIGDPSTEVGCSHSQAYLFYIESINSPCPFIGFQCEDVNAFDNGECILCDNNRCSVMGYYADKYKGRGNMYLTTNPKSPYCGYHHLFEIQVTSDSAKTAGEIAISIDQVTNNEPKPLTGSNEDIKPGQRIKKVFITEHDMVNIDSVDLKFTKKAGGIASWIGKDPNAVRFTFEKMKITNVEIDETFTQCSRITMEDKQTTKVSIKEGECAIRKKETSFYNIFSKK